MLTNFDNRTTNAMCRHSFQLLGVALLKSTNCDLNSNYNTVMATSMKPKMCENVSCCRIFG